MVDIRVSKPAEPELKVGRAAEGKLDGDQSVDYMLDLELQEVALVLLESAGLQGRLCILDPGGRAIRMCGLNQDGEVSAAFVADVKGCYRVRVMAAPGLEGGCYKLVLKQKLKLEERVRQVEKPRLEGSRIARLRAQLTASAGQTELFWAEIERLGTPLLEPDPDDAGLTLCTFIWKGAELVRNVRVHLLFRTTLPNEYEMTRVEGTDVWYTTIQLPSKGRFAYRLLVNRPSGPPPEADSAEADKLIYFASAQADPLNPRRCFETGVSRYEEMSLLEMPDAPLQPWADKRPGIRCGIVERFSFHSRVLQNDRFVSVYTPPDYSEQAGPYGLLVVFDEQWFLARIPVPVILDNLLDERNIPPLVAVFVGNGPGNARSRELPCNPLWAEFIANELIVWVRNHYHVTWNPEQVVVAGASYGGLAASYVALKHSGIFGNVLSQSGSYWWQSPDKAGQLRQNYMVSLVLQQPRLPLRFYLDAGTGEIGVAGNARSILEANRHLRDVLLAKGYEVNYQEFVGGHDFLSWRGTFADGLIWLSKCMGRLS